MGLEAKFSADQVSNILNRKGKKTTLALRNRLKEAAKETHAVMRMLVPYKSGTLQKAIRIRKNNPNSWTIWINEDQKVPKKRGSIQEAKQEVYVRDYLLKIESGNFEKIGPRSREKEGYTNKRKLAGLKVRRSPQGTYVGGVFFGRTIDALEAKWQERFAKVFKSAMERGLI